MSAETAEGQWESKKLFQVNVGRYKIKKSIYNTSGMLLKWQQ